MKHKELLWNRAKGVIMLRKQVLSGGYVIDFLLCYSELGKRKIYWKLQ